MHFTITHYYSPIWDFLDPQNLFLQPELFLQAWSFHAGASVEYSIKEGPKAYY